MSKIAVGDTETTGILDYKNLRNLTLQPYIVQLGVQLYNEESRLLGELNFLIKPDGWTIPAEATAIHGISTEDCEKYGIPIRWALGILKMWLELEEVIFVAHNLDFDKSMINIECERLGKDPIVGKNSEYCTMKKSTNLLAIPKKRGGFKWPNLQELHFFLFGTNFDGAHNAAADVAACGRCYFELIKRGIV